MSDKNGKKTRGNSIAEQAALDGRLHRNGFVLETAEHTFDRCFEEEILVSKIVFRAPAEPGGEWLAVISAHAEGEAIVGFHRAMTFGDTVVGLLERLNNRSLKWNKDKYAS